MSIIALDIETTGLNPRRDAIHGIGVACGEDAKYLSFEDAAPIRELLADPDKVIVGHNLRFDLRFLIQQGWEIKCQWWDTKVLAQLLNENIKHGLKDLTAEYFGISSLTKKSTLDIVISKEGLKHVGQLCKLDLNEGCGIYYDLIATYCMEDCKNTLQLWGKLRKQLLDLHDKMLSLGFKETLLNHYTDEAMPTERVLLKMDLRGIRVDAEELKKYHEELSKETNEFERRMHTLLESEIAEFEENLYQIAVDKRKTVVGKAKVKRQDAKYKTIFSWQSNDHLAWVFYEKLGIPVNATTKSGKPSVGAPQLKKVVNKVPQGSRPRVVLELYQDWRKNQKILSMIAGEKSKTEEAGILSKVDGGRIYADYLQVGRGNDSGGTKTGRLSSRNPNMQNLPTNSKIKRYFLPDEGYKFIYFDYSQLELRIAAHLSKDARMMYAYNTAGVDLHQMTAEAIGRDRKIGKTVNFGTIYGISAVGLSSMLNLSVGECDEILHRFFDAYEGYTQYVREQIADLKRTGVAVSEVGRVRRLPVLLVGNSHSKEYKHAIRQGCNFPIQSLGASITKRAMLELDRQGYKCVTQIHDAVVVQYEDSDKIAQAVEDIRRIAESVYSLRVPLVVDIKVLTSLSSSDNLEQEDENG